MSTIYALMPDHKVLLSLEPEELAGIVLEYLHSLPKGDPQFSLYNFSLPHTVAEYPCEHQKNITNALREAWEYLKNKGFTVPTKGFHDDMVSITRKGESVKNVDALEAYRKANLLPKQLLHSAIAEDIWSHFSRGKYDIAIFEAFKAVEVAVRNASGYSEKYGTELMRQAFKVENGPLIDHSQPKAEREATLHLFSGSIGLYKNRHSHRNVTVKAEEAVEIIMFASHLLRIVDSRAPTPNAV